MLVFAIAAAVAIQVARLAAFSPGSAMQVFGDPTERWFVRDLGLFVLPVLAGYLAVVRRMPWRRIAWLAALVAALAIAVNVFPYAPGSATEMLVALHLPVVLWFVVGAAYAAGR
ncbi:MAG: hypothetical protein R2717_04010 [Schumannella sp.]